MDPSDSHGVFRLVQNRDELAKALRLVHENYVRCGYMAPQPGGIRINIHYAARETRCFVAVVRKEVFATVTLFLHSALGLPASKVYADNIAPLLLEGRRIGEVGMLADRRRTETRSFSSLLRMVKRVFWTALDLKLDDLVITVNPKHVRFYRRMLCFEPLGPTRPYSAVGNAPATLLRVNLADLQPEKSRDANIRKLFLAPPEDALSDPYVLTADDMRYLFAERSDVFANLTPDERDAVEALHPGLSVEACLEAAATTEDVAVAGKRTGG